MKAAVITGPAAVEIREVDIPRIKPDEVLVKIKCCGICTLEQRLYSGDVRIFYPIIAGHEASGEIVEVGSDVLSALKPGMRAAVDMITRCGECFYCRSGHSNMCKNRFNKGVKVLGGFGEYIAVKASQVFLFPDTVSFREAAFTEPVSCCIRSLKKIDLKLSDDLLVIGAGPMGLMHLQVGRAMGARVFVSDPDIGRLEKAAALGASFIIDPVNQNVSSIIREQTDGKGADAVVITSPAHGALNNAMDSLSKTGRVNIYTSYGDSPPVPVDANTLHRNEYLITGSEGRTRPDFLQAMRLITFGMIDVKTLISKTVGFSEIEDGIKAAMSSGTYRVLLEHGA